MPYSTASGGDLVALKTSLIITGDSSVAKKAVDELKASVAAVGSSATAAAAPIGQLDAAQQQLGSSAKATGAAMQTADTAIADAARSARSLSTVNGAVVASSTAAGASVRKLTQAANDNADAARRQQFAIRNAGQQVGDFGLSISAGISPAQAFAQQAGQMGYALSEMGGKAGAVGAFLTGPWGIALTIAAAVLAPFVQKLFETAAAAEAVELGSSGLADAQGALGQVFDLVTGKLKKQNVELSSANELMRLNIRLTAINLRTDAAKEAASSQKAFGSAGSISASDRVMGALGGRGLPGMILGAYAGTDTGRQNAGNLQNVVKDLQSGRTTNEQVLRASEKLDFTGLKITKEQFQAAIRDGVSAVAKRQIADLADKSLDDNVLAPALRNDGRTKKPPKAKSTEGRDEFGRDAADKIAGIIGAFDQTPPVLDKTNAKIRELDDLIEDLGRKRPPGFAQLIAQAEAAKTIVRDGLIAEVAKAFEQPKTLAEKAGAALSQLDAVMADLSARKPPDFGRLIEQANTAKGVIADALNKPLDDYLASQREQLRIGDLINVGHHVEADTLRTILSLEKQRGPLSDAQKASILASNVALQAQAQQLDRIRTIQQINLSAVDDIRSIVTQTIYEGPNSLADLPGRLLGSFKRFQAELITEQVFGQLFRDLRDQVTGANKVDAASNQIVESFAKTAAAANQLSNALSGAATPNVSAGTSPGVTTDPDTGEISVTASRTTAAGQRKNADIYGDAIAKGLGKIGLGKDAAMTIGRYAGKGLEGAAVGGAINSVLAPIGKALGIRTSQTGAQIGGAIGSFVPIPGGKIIGSIAGSLLGGLFKGKEKAGGATVSGSADGSFSTGASGSNKGGISTGTGLAGNITDGLSQIAQQLGGAIGAFNVSIGTYKGDLRVNTNGRALGGVKNSGATGFGEDQNAAVNFAIAQAVGQGAIQGVSDAVAKALRSSTDVDKALKEALKVQELEVTIGGIGAQIDKAFKDFEATAKERVRLAGAYGFDLVAIEKRNAEERIKLTDQLLKSQVGSLQSLVTEITQGSLFEGTALDRITTLNGAIAKAKADLDSGVDGAADTLSGLYQQRLAASKEAYGTTSGYAADRAATLNEAQAAIAAANARIVAAQGTKTSSDPALATTNATLDEMADQNARIVVSSEQTAAALAKLTAGKAAVPTFDLREMAAY